MEEESMVVITLKSLPKSYEHFIETLTSTNVDLKFPESCNKHLQQDQWKQQFDSGASSSSTGQDFATKSFHKDKGKSLSSQQKISTRHQKARRRRMFSATTITSTVTSTVTWSWNVVNAWLLNPSKEVLSLKRMLQNTLSRTNLPFMPSWLKDLQIMWSLLPGISIQVLLNASLIDVTGSQNISLSPILWSWEEGNSIPLSERAMCRFNLVGGIWFSSMSTTIQEWNSTFSLSIRLWDTLLGLMWSSIRMCSIVDQETQSTVVVDLEDHGI